MAIDYNAGINSIDVGAHDITYSGNQGPKSPEQERQMAFDDTPRFELQPLEELLEEFRQDNYGEDPKSIDDLRRFFYNKYGPKGIAKVEQAVQREEQQAQMQQREGIQMASAADPMLQDEYDKYVFEMEEQGLEPMSLEQFRQEAVAGMATGGRVGLQWGGPPGGGETSYGSGAATSGLGAAGGATRSGGDGDAQRHQAQQEQAKFLSVPRGKETISPGTGVITRPDGTVDTGGGYIHRPTGIVYDQDYIDKFINVGDKDEKELEKLARKKKKYEASQKRKRTRIENQQRKKLITLLKRRKKQDPDWKGVIPEGWEEDATLNELYGWASTQDWTGKEKYSDLEGRELNEFFEKHGYVPTSKDFPGILGAVYPEKPVTFDEIEQAFQKGKGSLYHKGADDYRVWSPDPDSKEADWLQEMKAFSPMQYANYMGMDWNPVTGEFTKRQDDGYGGVPGAVPHGDIPEWQRQGYPSYEAWLAAQGPGTTPDPTPDPTIPTGSVTLPYTVNPLADDLTQGRGGWFYNDGGRVGYAGGGIADLRQGYFLGKIVKSITKPFKGVSKKLKKLTKNPWVKTALLAAAMGYPFGGGANAKWFGQGSGWGGLKSLAASDKWYGKDLLGKMLFKEGDPTKGISPWKIGIMGASLAPMLGFGQDDEEDENKMYEDWLKEKAKWDATYKAIPTTSLPSPYTRYLMGAADGGRIGYDNGGSASDRYEAKIKELMDKGLSRELAEALVLSELSPDAYRILDKKDGGRIGYSGGGGYNDDEEEDHRSAALRHLYGLRRGAQEGGLMDLGGMEKDYRNEGGFVPIGAEERADDVPARLSKNEFVFTADAVRAAGGGDIDKGAEIMENVMENLEQGGNISEESQGLEGARDMFATSQRLEGVL
jgi:hypothetical protein